MTILTLGAEQAPDTGFPGKASCLPPELGTQHSQAALTHLPPVLPVLMAQMLLATFTTAL